MKHYRSIEEFEREEIRPSALKVGFTFDDLVHESQFGQSDMLFDDTYDEYDPEEKDED